MAITQINAHHVAENLRMALGHAKMSQSELARRAGVARTTVWFAMTDDPDKARIPLVYSLCPIFEVLKERVPWLTLESILMGTVPRDWPKNYGRMPHNRDDI